MTSVVFSPDMTIRKAEMALLADERLQHLWSQSPLVTAQGAVKSPVMVVGEAPGEQETAQLIPFVGPAGQLLNELLVSAGISRSVCYVTNAVPFRPPGNRTPTLYEIIMCRPLLEAQVTAVRAPLIIALGATALKALTSGLPGVSRMHGRTVKFRDVPGGIDVPRETTVFCTYHPSAALRDAVRDREIREDFAGLKEIIERGGRDRRDSDGAGTAGG